MHTKQRTLLRQARGRYRDVRLAGRKSRAQLALPGAVSWPCTSTPREGSCYARLTGPVAARGTASGGSCYARLAGPDAERAMAPELARAGSAPPLAAGLALAAEILAAESRSASAGSPPSANACSTCAQGRAAMFTCMWAVHNCCF